nr:hypothetical protein [Tanacetum cinerariifolium]
NIIRDTLSPTDAELGVDTDKINSKGDTKILNIGGEQGEDHPDEEHVHVENPLSSTRTLSSMKNLDAYTYEDQFFNDKPMKEDLRKINMETKVESMVTVPIYQASSLVPPLSTLVIDLTAPKHVPSTTQASIFTATTTTKTTTTLLPPPQKQSFSVPNLASFKDVPIPDDVNILDSEDTDTAHLPMIKTRPDWLKPVPEEDIPETPEPDWIIPPNDLLKTKNNWAKALAKSYQDPNKYKLLRQAGDMSSFINWFYKWIENKKLSKKTWKA